MSHKVMGFVDGENTVLRYQAMCKAGAKPKKDVVHIPDVLAWHNSITQTYFSNYIRISFYQTVVGDERRLNEIRGKISDIKYPYMVREDEATEWSGSLVPRVFKKERKTAKTKSVDINLTVDMLRHAMNPSLDVLFLLSGDGDYVPLIEEISRQGKQVWVAAFSDGCNENLRFVADEFQYLDEYFFK